MGGYVMKALAAKAVTTLEEGHRAGQTVAGGAASTVAATYFELWAPYVGVVTSTMAAVLVAVTIFVKVRKEYRDTIEFNERNKD
jgi:hypothetical protein